MGTVLLVEEDIFGSYSRLLLKYFLSEGIMCGHSVFLASASEQPADIVKDLPGAVDDEHSSSSRAPPPSSQTPPPSSQQEGHDQMKIAWRYQNLPAVQSSFSNRFGHFFDLTRSMSPARVEAVERVFFNAMETTASSDRELYSSLRSSICETIQARHFSVDETPLQQRNVLRIALHSLGSPLWLEGGGGTDATPTSHSPTLPQFLHSLRALLRRAYAVAMVTIPTYLMQLQDTAYVQRLERLSDAAVRLESFAGSEKEQNPVYREYHGLFHLRSLPRLNSLAPHLPETLDLAFKLKRKKFSIEKLHLPPELSETASRAQEDATPPASGAPRKGRGTEARKTVGGEEAESGRTKTPGSRYIAKHNIDF